jgi:uncharacterized protein
MSIFAIADLHLSGDPPNKPMDRFSPDWVNHWGKIQTAWQASVSSDDTVLIAGDTSWAMRWADALQDLAAIASLPGRKVIVRGNHDYWWGTVGKMQKEFPDTFFFLHNNYFFAEGWAICGSRGWITPDDPLFLPEDEPIYQREAIRVRTSLNAARADGCAKILLMLHYPPVYQLENSNSFTALIREFAVELCVFGHIHGNGAHMAPEGDLKGATCHLVACDALNFAVKKII